MKRALARIVSVAAVFAVAVTGVQNAAAQPQDDAVTVQRLQDELTAAAAAGDVDATGAALSELDTTLARISDGNKDLTTPARAETATAQDAVAERFADDARTPYVPTVPEALNMLLQKLLAALSELVDNLLGGGVPLPV
jgi:predicted trehalose synthase